MRWNICFKATNQTSSFSPDFSNPHYLIFSNKALSRRENQQLMNNKVCFNEQVNPQFCSVTLHSLFRNSINSQFSSISISMSIKKCKKQNAEEISRIHRKLENQISTQLNFISHTAVNPESAKRFRIRQTTNYPAENAFNRNRDQRI